MSKLVFLCLVFLFTNLHAEDVGKWNYILTLGGGADFYAAPSSLSIDKKNKTIKFLSLINEKSTKRLAKTNYRSWVIDYVVNCKSQTGIVRKLDWYSGEFGSGELVRSENSETSSPLDPKRPVSNLAISLCHEYFK